MAELIYDEVKLFGVCLLLGIRIALFYDLFRILRMFIPHGSFAVNVEDLIFWLFTAWQVFETLFYYNRGTLRAYAFMGMFLGVLLYALTVSRIILRGASLLVPYWQRFLDILKKPFGRLKLSCRKMLKNLASQVKMAMKSR